MNRTVQEGSSQIIWIADDKIKNRWCNDEDDLERELQRLKEIVPPNKIIVQVVDWNMRAVNQWRADE